MVWLLAPPTRLGKDQLVKVKDSTGIEWRNEYDLRGRKVKTVDPDRGTTTSVYHVPV